jgi:nicotinamide/nicotinate riboside kinase
MPSPLLIGLSGPSSSGKTTLARLLRSIFPKLILLHEDDFYRPEEELPLRSGLRDWDCAAAIDIPAFVKALRFIKSEGRLPDDLVSKEDQNAVGESGVSDQRVEELREEIGKWWTERDLESKIVRIVVVDGFLLFGESVAEIRELFDIRIFLRATYQAAKRRREARTGYVTLEGFWEDPPGYVDLVVWPAYVEEHGFLFKEGNVDGDVDEDVARKLGLEVCPGAGKLKINDMLEWLVRLLKEQIEVQFK